MSVLIFVLKNKLGHNYEFIALAQVLGGGIVFSYCYLSGMNSGFYLFLVGMTILPFFLFPQKKWKHLVFVELILMVLLVTVLYLFIEHKPIYPVPPELEYTA